jgi:hypothetical protein
MVHVYRLMVWLALVVFALFSWWRNRALTKKFYAPKRCACRSKRGRRRGEGALAAAASTAAGENGSRGGGGGRGDRAPRPRSERRRTPRRYADLLERRGTSGRLP